MPSPHSRPRSPLLGRIARWLPGLGVVTLLLGAGSCLAELPAGSGADSAASIRAHGKATVIAEPDRVWVDLAVVSRNSAAAAAVASNARQSREVEKTLRKSLGETIDIEAAGYSLAPNYRYVQGQGQQLDGYLVRNRLRISSADIEAAGRVIDAASEAGASEIQQVTFGLADRDAAGRDALAEATRNALARAKVMASALDLRVLRVLSVEDSAIGTSPGVRPARLLTKADSEASVPTTLLPGGVPVHAQATVFVEVGP
jgi:uncharacterized protein YggE